MLIEARFLAQLEQLSFVARRVRAGQVQGERRSTRRGTSVEFADYRDYARGDDLRCVDWNIYARLERPFVKLFEEEEDLAVHILLDSSGSMDWGAEDKETRGQEDKGTRGQGDKGTLNKWLYARRLAAALGAIALTGGDRLTITAVSDLQPATRNLQSAIRNPQFGPARGRAHTLRLFDWLDGLAAAGATDLNAALRHYALTAGRPGLAVLLSDLFSPNGYLEGLTALSARGYEIAVLHILSPDEVDPPLGGDLRLLDVESGDPQEVTIDGAMRALYRRRLQSWRDEIRAACRARDVHYVPLITDQPLERVVMSELRRAGVIK